MESTNQNFFTRLSSLIRHSVTLKLITIGILVLLLLIPGAMVQDLIRERESRQGEALAEVSAKWGQTQTLCGPVLTIPYTTWSEVTNPNNPGKVQRIKSTGLAHFLPDQLRAEGLVTPQKLNRGIFEVVVYNSRLHLTGRFLQPDFSDWKVEPADIHWDEATLSLGLTDLRSIQENVSVQWQNQTIPFNPGLESTEVMATGISARVPAEPEKGQASEFSIQLDFNGSSGLFVTPVGRTTTMSLRSAWTDPKFSGSFLPDTRKVTDSGFVATWKVLHLNRPYPQKFLGTTAGIPESAFGVDLLMPVDHYQKSMRSAKYAALFITLTFLVFFFAQILNNVRIHPFQYIVAGLALTVFYTLLVAISEHVNFEWSYLISSVSVIGLIGFYTLSIFRKRSLTLMTTGILIALYLFIFTIIQLQDYALLMGSIGLFVVLATIMILTRRIDWYAVGSPDNSGD